MELKITLKESEKGADYSHRLGLRHMYRGAYKSLARPGRKQVTATEDFDFHISNL